MIITSTETNETETVYTKGKFATSVGYKHLRQYIALQGQVLGIGKTANEAINNCISAMGRSSVTLHVKHQ